MYAIVRSGGVQHKVSVGDIIETNRLGHEQGDSVSLPAVLKVDDDAVTADADSVSGVSVTGEVLEHTQGPKINMQKFKNKNRYRRRLGHRQQLTQVKITGIS